MKIVKPIFCLVGHRCPRHTFACSFLLCRQITYRGRVYWTDGFQKCKCRCFWTMQIARPKKPPQNIKCTPPCVKDLSKKAPSGTPKILLLFTLSKSLCFSLCLFFLHFLFSSLYFLLFWLLLDKLNRLSSSVNSTELLFMCIHGKQYHM